ncbi:MAG: hypothetical protein QXK84_07090 [Nitrososphaerota archaeon]
MPRRAYRARSRGSGGGPSPLFFAGIGLLTLGFVLIGVGMFAPIQASMLQAMFSTLGRGSTGVTFMTYDDELIPLVYAYDYVNDVSYSTRNGHLTLPYGSYIVKSPGFEPAVLHLYDTEGEVYVYLLELEPDEMVADIVNEAQNMRTQPMSIVGLMPMSLASSQTLMASVMSAQSSGLVKRVELHAFEGIDLNVTREIADIPTSSYVHHIRTEKRIPYSFSADLVIWLRGYKPRKPPQEEEFPLVRESISREIARGSLTTESPFQFTWPPNDPSITDYAGNVLDIKYLYIAAKITSMPQGYSLSLVEAGYPIFGNVEQRKYPGYHGYGRIWRGPEEHHIKVYAWPVGVDPVPLVINNCTFTGKFVTYEGRLPRRNLDQLPVINNTVLHIFTGDNSGGLKALATKIGSDGVFKFNLRVPKTMRGAGYFTGRPSEPKFWYTAYIGMAKFLIGVDGKKCEVFNVRPAWGGPEVRLLSGNPLIIGIEKSGLDRTRSFPFIDTRNIQLRGDFNYTSRWQWEERVNELLRDRGILRTDSNIEAINARNPNGSPASVIRGDPRVVPLGGNVDTSALQPKGSNSQMLVNTGILMTVVGSAVSIAGFLPAVKLR